MQSDDIRAAGEVAASGPLSPDPIPLIGHASFSYGRAKRGYCASTAWVWERARLVCTDPAPVESTDVVV